MKHYKPLPPNLALEKTLARRINQLREARNLTMLDLSRMTKMPLERVEDLESGIESWLSATDRQRIATALSVEPKLLQEVELRPPAKDVAPGDTSHVLTAAILNGAREMQCPQCGGQLKCSVQEALDLDGNPTQFAKAFCMQCPFVLR